MKSIIKLKTNNIIIKIFIYYLIFLFLLMNVSPVLSYQIPMIINYQGLLTNTNKEPVDGTKEIICTIYKSLQGDEILWKETHEDVKINKGVFNVLIGSKKPLNLELFQTESYFSVTVNGEELLPRKPFYSVPISFISQTTNSIIDNGVTTEKLADNSVTAEKIANQAIDASKILDGPGSNINADKLDGKDSSEFVMKDNDGNIVFDSGIKSEDVISIKAQRPNFKPEPAAEYGKLFVRNQGIDFASGSSLVNDLLLYYGVNDLGDIISDAVSSNHGTAYNSPTIETGMLGKARSFDGNKSQYIETQLDDKFNFEKNSFSISFWMYAPPLDADEWAVILSRANGWGDDVNCYGWAFGNDTKGSPNLEFSINAGGIKRNTKTAVAENVFNNQWHHIVGVRDNETILLYVDGDLKYTETGVVQSVDVDNPLLIGQILEGDYYTGLFDELAIWKRAITEDEIKELFNNKMAKLISHTRTELYFLRNDGTEVPLSKFWDRDGMNIIFNGGKIGIGNQNPEHSLDVNGTVNANNYLGDGSTLTGVVKNESDPVWTEDSKNYYKKSEVYSKGEVYSKNEVNNNFIQKKLIIWSGGCSHHGQASGWNTYCTDREDFKTSDEYFSVASDGTFTVKIAGFYRVNAFTISNGGSWGRVRLVLNGNTIYQGHQIGSGGNWFDNHMDIIWPFNVGDKFYVSYHNPGSYAFYVHGEYSRLQVTYEGTQ